MQLLAKKQVFQTSVILNIKPSDDMKIGHRRAIGQIWPLEQKSGQLSLVSNCYLQQFRNFQSGASVIMNVIGQREVDSFKAIFSP